MANHTRNAFHLNRAKEYAQQAMKGLVEAGGGWAEDAVQRAGITHLAEVCAEHVGNIPREIQAKYPAVPWKPIADFRIIAAHRYHEVNPTIVAEIIQKHMPGLIQEIEKMLADEI